MATLYNPNASMSQIFTDAIPFILSGMVVATDDPDQMGRVRVWIPALDGETYDINNIPWANYAPPFGGYTVEYPAGEAVVPNNSSAAYGFWAIPKVGATVYVFCLNGDPDSRVFFASSIRLHRNRSFPAGRNTDGFGKKGPWGDTGDGSGRLNAIQPAYDNLRAQFQNKMDAVQAKTRGLYERQAAQPKTDKDGTEGYSPNAADPSYLDCQTYCLSTPGRHAIIMQDDPKFSRMRLKTAEGHQIIFDDANERIYISTARGNSWIELDQDGHISIFGGESFSVRSGADINLFADKNINMEAGGSINVKADTGSIKLAAQTDLHIQTNGDVALSACGTFDMSSETTLNIASAQAMNVHSKAGMSLTGDSGVDVKSGSNLKLQGSSGVDIKGGHVKVGGSAVDIGGGPTTISGSPLSLNKGSAAKPSGANTASDAACATRADPPSVVPGHEPWDRPVSTVPRGPNWSP